MENPFRYGGIVRGEYFADRQDELAELVREMKNLNRLFLISPRRFGKTCLLFNLMDQLTSLGYATVYLDINAYPDIRSLASAWTQVTSKALESNIDKLVKIFSGFQRLRPKVSVGQDGSLSTGLEVAVDEKNAISALLEGMSQADQLARQKKRKLIVFVDEFSDIQKYNGHTLEKALRSEIQMHEHIGYIFSGSEQSIMLSMIRDQSRAFYKLGRIMELGPIKRAGYVGFIQDWFKRSDFSCDKTILGSVFDLGEDIPYNIQRLCHNMWEKAQEGHQITPSLVSRLPFTIARQDSPHYEMLWQGISPLQKNLLAAISKTPQMKPLSKAFQLTHGIGPSSSIKASLDSLCKKGVLHRGFDGSYRYTDIFMSCWIQDLMADNR